MLIPTVVEFDGLSWRRCPESVHSSNRDYYMTYINRKQIYLHRHVWEFYNGPIPDGYCVHHLRDVFDNTIGNLEIMEKGEHNSFHMSGERNHLFGKKGESHPAYGNKKSKDAIRRTAESHEKTIRAYRYPSGEYVGDYLSRNKCAKALGIMPTGISGVTAGKRNHHKGYTFKYTGGM